MSSVRLALHIRTGQRAAVEAVDAWLADHHVQTVPFSDVYAACAHLVRHYEEIPELVLLGLDWLSEHETALARYVRETWPRTGLVLYGGGREDGLHELAAHTLMCHSEGALRKLLSQTPEQVLHRLRGEAQSIEAPPGPLQMPPKTRTASRAVVLPGAEHPLTPPRTGNGDETGDAPRTYESVEAPRVTGEDVPRAMLTPEELAALFDPPPKR